MKSEKTIGLIINLAIYILAFSIGYIPYYFLSDSVGPIWSMFAFTCVATLVVYFFCLVFKNTSIYDPYWSVAPLIMVLLHMFRFETFNLHSIILTVLVFVYSFRLTFNWFMTYKGLDPKYEDWRYKKYRSNPNRFVFHVINFFGLVYIPTFVVFAGILPGLCFMSLSNFSLISIVGFAFMVGGPTLEFISDHQSHKFIKECSDHSKVCDVGLWKFSRHPNYLGELMFWFGVALTFLFSDFAHFYFAFGFLPMLLLFIFISIPLMEKHNLEKRPEYENYKRHTSMLLILPRRK